MKKVVLSMVALMLCLTLAGCGSVPEGWVEQIDVSGVSYYLPPDLDALEPSSEVDFALVSNSMVVMEKAGELNEAELDIFRDALDKEAVQSTESCTVYICPNRYFVGVCTVSRIRGDWDSHSTKDNMEEAICAAIGYELYSISNSSYSNLAGNERMIYNITISYEGVPKHTGRAVIVRNSDSDYMSIAWATETANNNEKLDVKEFCKHVNLA